MRVYGMRGDMGGRREREKGERGGRMLCLFVI